MKSLDADRSTAVGKSPPDGALLTRGLGWFSLALATAELVAPAHLARAIGLRPTLRTKLTLRALGLRELVAGASILFQPRRPLPIWARVAGDAMDLGLMAWASTGKKTNKSRAAVALAGLAGATALDVYAALRTTKLQDQAQAPVMFSVTINKPPAEVYAYFRNLAHLPTFMDWLESVRESADGASHWIAKLPVAGTVEWDAEITEEKVGELIAWKTLPGAPLAHGGRVTFAKAPGRNSTEVRCEMAAGFPGTGRKSALLAKLFAKPQIKGDLRRLKQIMEIGEVLLSDASLHRGPHPAQPAAAKTAKELEKPAPMLDAASSGSGAPMRNSSGTGLHDASPLKGLRS